MISNTVCRQPNFQLCNLFAARTRLRARCIRLQMFYSIQLNCNVSLCSTRPGSLCLCLIKTQRPKLMMVMLHCYCCGSLLPRAYVYVSLHMRLGKLYRCEETQRTRAHAGGANGPTTAIIRARSLRAHVSPHLTVRRYLDIMCWRCVRVPNSFVPRARPESLRVIYANYCTIAINYRAHKHTRACTPHKPPKVQPNQTASPQPPYCIPSIQSTDSGTGIADHTGHADGPGVRGGCGWRRRGQRRRPSGCCR